MSYHLDNTFLINSPWITVVGCGGTGGFVAESLCRLFQGREATIVLVDHDTVEPHNLLRQNFYKEDVGRFKSQALAERLSAAYDRPIGYVTDPLHGIWGSAHGTPVSGDSGIWSGLPPDRLHRQRRRATGNGRLPSRQLPRLARGRGERYQLGPGSDRQCRRANDGTWRGGIRRPDLPPASGAHASATGLVDRRINQTARRRLRGGAGPDRSGPDDKPDDGLHRHRYRPEDGGWNVPFHGCISRHGPRDGDTHIRLAGGRWSGSRGPVKTSTSGGRSESRT